MTDSVDRTATVARAERKHTCWFAFSDGTWRCDTCTETWPNTAAGKEESGSHHALTVLDALDAHDAAHPQSVVDRLVAAGVLERCRVKSENRVTHVYVEVVPDPDGPLYRVVPS